VAHLFEIDDGVYVGRAMKAQSIEDLPKCCDVRAVVAGNGAGRSRENCSRRPCDDGGGIVLRAHHHGPARTLILYMQHWWCLMRRRQGDRRRSAQEGVGTAGHRLGPTQEEEGEKQ